MIGSVWEVVNSEGRDLGKSLGKEWEKNNNMFI